MTQDIFNKFFKWVQNIYSSLTSLVFLSYLCVFISYNIQNSDIIFHNSVFYSEFWVYISQLFFPHHGMKPSTHGMILILQITLQITLCDMDLINLGATSTAMTPSDS